MIEAIIEVWCSPLRSEDYSLKIIPLCAGDAVHMENEIKEFVGWDLYLNAFGVDYAEVKGLWKIVAKVSIAWLEVNTWDGIDYDVDIGYEEIFKGQCHDWTEVKYAWLELSGKAEEYFNKPWKKRLNYYTGTGSDYLDCVLGVGGFEGFGPIK